VLTCDSDPGSFVVVGCQKHLHQDVPESTESVSLCLLKEGLSHVPGRPRLTFSSWFSSPDSSTIKASDWGKCRVNHCACSLLQNSQVHGLEGLEDDCCSFSYVRSSTDLSIAQLTESHSNGHLALSFRVLAREPGVDQSTCYPVSLSSLESFVTCSGVLTGDLSKCF
jgi:hypothetical protein